MLVAMFVVGALLAITSVSAAEYGNEDAFVLIIKPSENSTFQNFVNIIDEVAISNIKRYYIDELSEADKKLLRPIKQ